jgi:hypothetical protein
MTRIRSERIVFSHDGHETFHRMVVTLALIAIVR